MQAVGRAGCERPGHQAPQAGVVRRGGGEHGGLVVAELGLLGLLGRGQPESAGQPGESLADAGVTGRTRRVPVRGEGPKDEHHPGQRGRARRDWGGPPLVPGPLGQLLARGPLAIAYRFL